MVSTHPGLGTRSIRRWQRTRRFGSLKCTHQHWLGLQRGVMDFPKRRQSSCGVKFTSGGHYSHRTGHGERGEHEGDPGERQKKEKARQWNERWRHWRRTRARQGQHGREKRGAEKERAPRSAFHGTTEMHPVGTCRRGRSTPPKFRDCTDAQSATLRGIRVEHAPRRSRRSKPWQL